MARHGILREPAVEVVGRIAPQRLDAIARFGYDQYARVTEDFTMNRPRWPIDAG